MPTSVKTKAVTIASGAVGIGPWHTQLIVTGEGGLADALDRIDGGYDGQEIVVQAADGATDITINDNAAGGNLQLDAATIVLASLNDTTNLVKSGDNWLQLSKAINA